MNIHIDVDSHACAEIPKRWRACRRASSGSALPGGRGAERHDGAGCGGGLRRASRAGRTAHRWGRTRGKIGFHGGKVEIERQRVRGLDGKEQKNAPLCSGSKHELCFLTMDFANLGILTCRRAKEFLPFSRSILTGFGFCQSKTKIGDRRGSLL